jgi:hypothetical protein
MGTSIFPGKNTGDKIAGVTSAVLVTPAVSAAGSLLASHGHKRYQSLISFAACQLTASGWLERASVRYHRIGSMATLFSITARRRDGMKPYGRCQGQTDSLPPTAISSSDAEAGADRSTGLARLTAQYYRRWQPVVIEERVLVDLLIAADWQLRRLQAGRQWRPLEPA